MKIVLLLAASIAVAKQSIASPPTTDSSRLASHDGESLLSSLLQVAGYTNTCVAGALDYCGTAEEDGHAASLIQEARNILQQANLLLKTWKSPPRHCKDLLDSGDSGSGLRQVFPYPDKPQHGVTVYCDHTVDGGGWTVFQRRNNYTIRQNFSRTWAEYKSGFGDLKGEFWLGLDLLHQLTSTLPQQLRIDLDDYDGAHRWAKYGSFQVGAPETHYTLSIERYSGNAGDSMTNTHNGQKFSTPDADHDTGSGNCAKKHRGAWWYNNCAHSNLNGYQHVGDYSASDDEGINWYDWRGFWYSLRRTSMMIRPIF